MIPQQWRTPMVFLSLTAITMSFASAGWMAMLNNFAVEKVNFTGQQIGNLHSIREIPGFLAFTVVFLLLVIKEQRLALISLALLTIGVAITGLLPFAYGFFYLIYGDILVFKINLKMLFKLIPRESY